jgi:beta-lactamase regulating signal transducer with metallopeptidase domain
MNESLTGLEFALAILVKNAWSAAILMVAVFCFQKACARWLSPRARHALWLLVAVRLLVLWAPASACSLTGALERSAVWAFSSSHEEPREAALVRESATPELAPAKAERESLPVVEFLPGASLETKATEPNWSWPNTWSLLALLWVSGASFFVLRLAHDFWRLCIATSKMQPAVDAAVLDLLWRLENEIGVRASLRLLVSEQLASPAVTGVFRPTLLMPRVLLDRLSLADLAHVFRHELTHVKRRDVLVNWLLSALAAVYWFFPLMGYLMAQLRRTRELACDAAVLRKSNTKERAAYGRTLVRVLEMGQLGDWPTLTFTVGVAGMVWPLGGFRKDSKMMRERLEIVMRSAAPRKRAGAAAVLLGAVLIAVGFTQAQEQRQEEKVAWDPAPSKRELSTFEVEQSYDLTATSALFDAIEMRGTKTAEEALRDWVEKVAVDSRWSDFRQVTIDWSGDTATIKHSPKGHTRFLQAIKSLHSTPELQFVIELRINSLSAADFGKLDLSKLSHAKNEAIPSAPPTISGAGEQLSGASEVTLRPITSQSFLLNETQMISIQKNLDRLPSHQRLQAPRVTTLNGQAVQITCGTSHPFITGAELINGVKQPLIEVLFSGSQSEMQVISLGGDKVWLRLNLRKSQVEGTAAKESAHGEIEFQSPKIKSISQLAGLEMNVGETLALFTKTGMGEGEKEEVQAVFATLRTIALGEAALSDKKSVKALDQPTLRDDDKKMVVTYDIAEIVEELVSVQAKMDRKPAGSKELAEIFEQLEFRLRHELEGAFDERYGEIEMHPSQTWRSLVVTATLDDHHKISAFLTEVKQLSRSGAHTAPSPSVKQTTLSLPVKDLLLFEPTTTKDELSNGIDDRLVRSEMRRIVELFKELNPQFAAESSGKVMRPNFDVLTIEVSGPLTTQELSQVKEYFHYMKSKVDKAIDRTPIDQQGSINETKASIENSSAITKGYDVSKLRIFASIDPDENGPGKRNKNQLLLAFSRLELMMAKKIPSLKYRENGSWTAPIVQKAAIAVHAPPEIHEQVRKLLQQIEKMSPEEVLASLRQSEASEAEKLPTESSQQLNSTETEPAKK